MSDVPKFVLKRLPEDAALETHPDADLLTGFVEKSLLEPERNRVTEHLARCSACRAVVALAMPESPELPEFEVPALTASRNARRTDWFNPAVLRWVVATAGIVALTSVGILQYRSFSFESDLIARYLFTTEHTSVTDNAGNPYLETVTGWKAVNVGTFSFKPDDQHYAFTIGYTNGFAAPTYQRVNGIKIGLQVSY